MKKILFAALVIVVLSGCASVQMGDPARDAALKTFTVPADRAAIYIYRNETLGAAVKMDIMLDGQNIGETASRTYLYREVAPGKHTVAAKAENTDTVELDLKPGTIAYLWQEVKIGVMMARTKLNLVTEAEGRKGVLESKLAVGR